MDSPQNNIWGPNLWTILHSAAERIGSKDLKRLPLEEKRLWLGLLGSLRYSLPCPLCKRHYTNYLNTTPITAISCDLVRQWLYNLHIQVNTLTGKSNTITIEQISELYGKPFCFSHHFTIVVDHMKRALKLGWNSREDIQRTLRYLEELKRFYDFF